MPKLGLGTGFSRSGLVTPGVVTDNLVMKHMYPARAVQKLSDGAAYFNGSNSYVDMGSDSTLDIGTSHMTVAGWVYWDGSGNAVLFSKGRSFAGPNYDTYGWSVAIHSTPRLYFDVYADGSGGADSVRFAHYIAITQADWANKWHHVACSRGLKNGTANDGRYRIYVDGVLESEKYATDGSDLAGSQGTDGGDLLANDGTISDAGNSFRLGSDSNGSSDLDGYISNCALWKRELTQAQIKSIMFKQYADLTTSEKTSLVSWWNLDSTSAGDNATYDVLGSTFVLDNNISLGPNLYQYANGDISGITAYGNNKVESDGDAIKVTYVDDDDGAKFRFRDASVLTSDLDTDKFYQIKVTAKINTGHANLRINTDSDYYIARVDVALNTDFVEYISYFKPDHAQNDYLRLANMSEAEIMFIKDFSIKEVTGNIGTLL